MKLKHLDGQISPIESIILREELDSTTYNLSIDVNHNYFVGAGVLVHNEGEVNYHMGGENYLVYTGQNSQYPNKIYVGITKLTTGERLSRHHKEARDGIKEIENIPEAQRTPKQVANLEFYKFKLGIPDLKPKAIGIKTESMAQYIEENLVRFYIHEGEFEITNRDGGRRTPGKMDSIARELANDTDVQKQGYCN